MNRSILIAAILAAAPAFAQWPDKPKTETKTDTAAPAPAPAPAATPAPQPAPRRAARATASEDDGSGFGLGVRGAWAFPSGNLTTDESLSSRVHGHVPLWVEAGYHINRNIYAGAYFQWAPSFIGSSNCLPGSDCSSSGMRFGIEGIYNFMPSSIIQPWAGLGFGYEIFKNSRDAGDDRTFKGLELLNVQAGVDFGTSKFAIGPFVSYQLFGKFTSVDANGQSNSPSNTDGHSWLQLGLKLGFTL